MNSDHNNSCSIDNSGKTDIAVSVTYPDENANDNSYKSIATEQLIEVLKKYSNEL